MPFDKEAALEHLRANKKQGSTAECAKYVRKALVAGGMDTSRAPVAAKNYGPFLLSKSFLLVTDADIANWGLQPADIVVIQPYKGGSIYGHIAMFDGIAWISDFQQRDMWGGPGYRSNKPPYAIYRFAIIIAGLATTMGANA